MALQYLFDPNKQFQSIGGVNEVSGFLRVYLNGTDDRATTYRNFDGGLNDPDIVLDTYGRAVVIVDDTKTYRLEVYNRLGGLMWTVSNYKARGGSGGGNGTPVSVEGTVGEIDVDENTEGGVKHFVVGLAATIKNAIATLTMAVNGVANALNGKKDKQTPVNESGSTTKTIVGITQDDNGEISPEFDDIAFPDWTSAINAAVAACEKLENKKTTVTGFESSDTYYPTIKAVVDFVNGMLQNLGGKLITDNGNPFTSSAALPSSTPYGGVDIATKDYAYIQNVGTAERWSATVSGSSVVWVQEYAISIPVFTPAQQAAIDSGATSTKVGNYDAHLADTNNPHGVTAAQVGALTPTGNGSDVTATFTAAGSRVNISTGEKLSVIFGKIAKWFADLKALAFKDNVSDSDISGTIADTHIASASAWNAKQNALPTSGTASSTFAINISGTAEIANYLKRAYVNKSSQTTKIWKKVATSKTFTNYDAGSICFLYNHSGYIDEKGLDSIVSISIHAGNSGSLVAARIYTYSYRSESETQLLRIGSTNQYEVWVKVPTSDTNMYATLLNSYNDWTINTDVSQTGQLTDDEFTAYKSSNPSVGTSYNYNIAKASKAGAGSTRLPVFANSDGILSPINIDEYYCWAEPTLQWTDAMEMAVYGIENECNNECLGAVKRINLTSSHPSICYLNVRLPELAGAGRYRFTLEFEIINSSGILVNDAYGVLIIVPPTGYSGEPFLAECVYDSSGKPQSGVMNQFHIPQQGQTTRHKLYVDGHTYRVVKTK